MITNSVEEAILLSDAIVPIVAGPPATVGAPIPVELPRPRSTAQLAHEELPTPVRAHVMASLTPMRGPLRPAPHRRGEPTARAHVRGGPLRSAHIEIEDTP
jgi:hypothetical protein